MVFSVYDFKALKSLTLTPDSGWYPRGGGRIAPFRPQVTIVVRIGDYDSFLSLKNNNII
jgi:hypothetical protein